MSVLKYVNMYMRVSVCPARDGVRRRHGHLPGGDVDVHHRDPRPPRLPLGLALPRRLRRGGPRPQVSTHSY